MSSIATAADVTAIARAVTAVAIANTSSRTVTPRDDDADAFKESDGDRPDDP